MYITQSGGLNRGVSELCGRNEEIVQNISSDNFKEWVFVLVLMHFGSCSATGIKINLI